MWLVVGIATLVVLLFGIIFFWAAEEKYGND